MTHPAQFPGEALARVFPNLQLVETTRTPEPPFYKRQRIMTPDGLSIVHSVRRNKSGIEGIDGEWMVEARPEAGDEHGNSRPIETYFARECEAVGL